MAKKQFTKHAQRVLSHNPNVVTCSQSKITFTDEFALKVCDALKKGEDPYKVFIDAGFSIKILGESRINGAIGLWKSKYELENLPRRKPPVKEKKVVETASERRGKNLDEAIKYCDSLIATPSDIPVEEGSDSDTIHFAAIKKTYETMKSVIVKDLCAHYGYQYSKYYNYLKSFKPEDDFVNILNSHKKRK